MIDSNILAIGDPVNTEFGLLRPLTYKEYIKYMNMLVWIPQNSLHIYYMHKKEINPFDKKSLEEIKIYKTAKLTDIVKASPHMLQAYYNLLYMSLDLNDYTDNSVNGFIEKSYEDGIFRILSILLEDEVKFMEYRETLMEFNLLKEELVSENEEIQKFNDMSKRAKQTQGANNITPADIVSSIVAETSYKFNEVYQITAYQVNSLYARICAIKNYDTNTLFATVSSEKVNIEPWNKHLPLFEKEDYTLDKERFTSQMKENLS